MSFLIWQFCKNVCVYVHHIYMMQNRMTVNVHTWAAPYTLFFTATRSAAHLPFLLAIPVPYSHGEPVTVSPCYSECSSFQTFLPVNISSLCPQFALTYTLPVFGHLLFIFEISILISSVTSSPRSINIISNLRPHIIQEAVRVPEIPVDSTKLRHFKQV